MNTGKFGITSPSTDQSFFNNGSVDFVLPPPSPTMTITATASGLPLASGSTTNNTSIALTFTSSASTTSFAGGDITITNGSLNSSFAGIGTDGKVYTATFTPTGQGVCTIDVSANKFTSAGQNNVAATQFTWTFDSFSPSMTITSTTSGVTSGSTTKNTFIDLTFTSTEATNNFLVGDISVTNGTISNFAGIGTDGAVYTARFTPTGPGACTIGVLQGAYTDAATNLNNLATQFNWTFDSDYGIPINSGVLTYIPTPLSFVDNKLTIANTIDATDTDVVSFQLTTGNRLYPLSVSSFSGTGTVTYSLDISGGSNVKSGTFSSAGPSLLPGDGSLTASVNTTYILTMTANAAISYTIVGYLDYGIPNISWTSPTETILRASNLEAGDSFGQAVAISGNYAIVGAPYEDGEGNSTPGCGAAYIFERDGSGNWIQNLNILRASNLGASDGFGLSVAISGNYAIVGAYNEAGPSNATAGCGAAYIFERDGSGNWIQYPIILRANNLDAGDNFGYSVSISGNYAIVGARYEAGEGNAAAYSGAAYVFERNDSGNWFQKPIFRSSNLDAGDRFGTSVAISGNYAIVGAYNEAGEGNATAGCGAAYIFERNGSGNWIQNPIILRASNLDSQDIFGISVAISGNYAIVGAYQEDGTSNTNNCGAAYIFERDGSGNWAETKILRASNLNLNNWFGQTVAISGNYAIVGTTQVNSSAGAAYMFERSTAGSWTEKKIIQSSNLESGDLFSGSVAISGNYAIVGAYSEDGSSNATGTSGAAYIYSANLTPNPTPLSFVDNALTIANSIDAADTDKVSFALSAGASLYPFGVTSFSGTGTVTYSLDISGGANVKTGTFSANNVDLLAGTPVTATGNTTYIFTLTSNAAIAYTIVGGILTSPTNIILSNNSVNELQPIGTTIGTLTCDNPINSFITYSVSDTTRFSITGSTLKTNVIFDYETTSSYTVTITAAIGGLSSSSSKTITVINISGEAAELRRQNLQGSALKTAADSQGTPITATQLKDASFNATELKAAAYSVVQLKAASFTAVQLKDASFNATELKDASFNATELKTALFTAVQLKDASFNLIQLKDASFNATELKAALFTAIQLKDVSFNATDLKTALFTATELKDASFNLIQLKDASFNATELKTALFTAVQLKDVSFNATDLKTALFTATELKDASFNLIQLKDASFNATELKTALFTAVQLKDVSFNAVQLKDASFTATELKDASFNAIQLKDASFTATELKTALFTATELKDASFNAIQLKDASFNATQLRDVGFTATEMKSGFNATELKAGGYNATALKDGGFTATEMKSSFNATELKEALFNATQLKEASFNATELKDVGFTATEMKSSFNATELKTGGYNATELKTGGFTATEMKSSFNATELKTGGYDATQLIDGGFLLTELKTAAFTAKNLKDANVLLADLINIDYNATELNEADFTATELKDSGEFTINDLKDGGYTATEMKTAQYDATQLKTVGYSATQMKDAAFTATELYSVGYTSTQLVFGGFNSSSLIILGIVPDWNINENANCITTSYVQDFVDVSGCIILRENANLHMHGKLETAGNLLLNRMVLTADASFNRRIFVGGDVSMNGKVAVSGDIYMNGNVTKCAFNNSSIPKSAFSGTVPDGPNYNTSRIVYDQKFQANADVSMNGPIVAANNVKVSGNIVFNDGTVMNTYDNNILSTNPTVFKPSTFSSLDICGNLVAGSYATSSDYRIKTNIVELDETYTVDKLRPVKYYQTQINREKYGLIAHELQEHYPDLVVGEKDGSELQRVNYTGLIAILINEIKRMKNELSELENDVGVGKEHGLI